MGLTNGMTGGSIFKDRMKPTAPTSNDSTDKYSVTFQKKQTSDLPTEQISSENVEKILKELTKLQRTDAELTKKQEQLPREIEQQIQKNLKALSAEAAQSFDNYLKAITAQRIADAGRSLERLNALEDIYQSKISFSQKLKKICVGLLIANAVLLTAILIILILK